jgi:glyoxylase-like metal-dependent hydrolase (beta-lactamase superfamily II)
VEEVCPDAILMGHLNTLNRISTKLKCVPVEDDKIPLGDDEVQLCSVFTPGHTDGHSCLFESKTSALVAGDHCVGYGSSVLDYETGDMKQYFETTKKLINMNPKIAYPAHGPPIYSPVELFQQYIKHRQAR